MPGGRDFRQRQAGDEMPDGPATRRNGWRRSGGDGGAGGRRQAAAEEERRIEAEKEKQRALKAARSRATGGPAIGRTRSKAQRNFTDRKAAS